MAYVPRFRAVKTEREGVCSFWDGSLWQQSQKAIRHAAKVIRKNRTSEHSHTDVPDSLPNSMLRFAMQDVETMIGYAEAGGDFDFDKMKHKQAKMIETNLIECATALGWLFADYTKSTKNGLTFLDCCEAQDLDPQLVRSKLLDRWANERPIPDVLLGALSEFLGEGIYADCFE